MQSSAMVALRTMTMIVCLVAVPLAAVLGTTLPKVMKSAFGQKEARPASEPVSAAPPDDHDLAAADVELQEMAPLAISEGDAPDAAEPAALPQVHITGVQPAADSPALAAENVIEQPPIETAPLWNPAPRTASSIRSGETTTHFIPPNTSGGDEGEQPRPHAGHPQPSYGARQRPGRRDDSLRKTVYSPPDEGDRPVDTTSNENAPAEPRLAPVERVSNDGALADGERRLRALGVTYYRLEPWGGENTLYRCSCNVAFRPNSRASRHFDAIEAAPSLALDAVIKQVEAWRGRR